MAAEDQIPLPAIDGDSRPYWQGTAQGELRIQRCAACQRHVFYPRAICPHCGSDQLAWITTAGEGVIYSFTVVHQAYGPFAAQLPFVVALVDLVEGVRMMTRITGSPPAAVRIGQRVRVVYERITDDVTLPYFALI